jgi:putative heme iron utilization protein
VSHRPTHSRTQPGFPFGSLMPYALDKDGRLIFLISTMAMHTQNLQADPRASLFVTEPDAGGNPLGAARVTLIGDIVRIPESDLPEARLLYLASYSDSRPAPHRASQNGHLTGRPLECLSHWVPA